MAFPKSTYDGDRFADKLIGKAKKLVQDDVEVAERMAFVENEAKRLRKALADNDIPLAIAIRAIAELTSTSEEFDQLEENVRAHLSSELESERRREEQEQAEERERNRPPPEHEWWRWWRLWWWCRVFRGELKDYP